MKKSFLGFLLLAVTLAGIFTLCSCSKADDSEFIKGTWKSENFGYYTLTTFGDDATLNSVYKVSDEQVVSDSGLSQEILDAMEINSYYKIVLNEALDEEAKAVSKGRNAIKTYFSIEDMEKDQYGDLSFYEIKKDKLIVNGNEYVRYEG